MSVVEKRKLVTTKHPHLSVVKQCELLGIHRSGFYFKPRGESGLNLRLMEYIDKKFMECPFYGVNRMTSYLRYEPGYAVNEKRIRRLYRQMGLQTVYPKPNLSKKEIRGDVPMPIERSPVDLWGMIAIIEVPCIYSKDSRLEPLQYHEHWMVDPGAGSGYQNSWSAGNSQLRSSITIYQ